MQASKEFTADEMNSSKIQRTSQEHAQSMVWVKQAVAQAMTNAPVAIDSDYNSSVDHLPEDLPSFPSHPHYQSELDDLALQRALSRVLRCTALNEMDAQATTALIVLFSAFQSQLSDVKDKPLVLVMGDHLSGKSTALNYLAGQPFAMSGEGEQQTLTVTQDTPAINSAPINHTTDSSWLTCLPSITYNAQVDTHFLEVPDCILQPSAALALLNTLIVQRAMMMAQSVKTVLLFDMAQLYTETTTEQCYFMRLGQYLNHLTEQGVGVDNVLMGFTKVPLKMQMMPINLNIIKEFLFSRFTQLPTAFREQILICDPLETRAQQGCGLSDWLARIGALDETSVELIRSKMVTVSSEEQTLLLDNIVKLESATRAKALSAMLPLFPQCADQIKVMAAECKSAMGVAMQSIVTLIQQQHWHALSEQVIHLAKLESEYVQLDLTHIPIVESLLERIDRIQFQSTLLTMDEATLREWLQGSKMGSARPITRSQLSNDQIIELIDSGYSQQEVDLMASQGIPAFLMRKLVDSTTELTFEQSVNSIVSCIDLGLIEAQKVVGKEVVLVVGNSGCGKSTAVNYLVGCEMEIQREGFTSQVRVKDNSAVSEVTPIGHDERSKTFIPMIAPRNNNTLFVDAPGFYDNRGTEINIANAVNTKNLLAVAKSVRLTMLFPFSSLDMRGRGVSEMIGILQSLFGEQCELESIAAHVVVGVTRVPLSIDGTAIEHADIVDKVMSYQLLPECFRSNIMILDPLERRVDEQNGLTHWQDRFDQLIPITDTQSLFKTVLSSEDELMLLKASQHIARDVAHQLAIPKPAAVAAQLNQLRALQAVDHPQVCQLYRDNVEQLDQLVTQQTQALQQRMTQSGQKEQNDVGESLVEYLNSVRLLAVFNSQYVEQAQHCLTQYQHAHCSYLLAQFEQQVGEWQALVLRIDQIPLDAVTRSYNHLHDLIMNKPELFNDCLLTTVLSLPLIKAQSESLKHSVDAIKHYALAACNQSLLDSMQSRFMTVLQETLATVERVFTHCMHQQLIELQNVCSRQWSVLVAQLQWDKQEGGALLAALNTVKNMDTFEALHTLLAAFKTIDALDANATMMVDTMQQAHSVNSTLLQPEDLNAWANFSYESFVQARKRVTDQAQQAEQSSVELLSVVNDFMGSQAQLPQPIDAQAATTIEYKQVLESLSPLERYVHSNSQHHEQQVHSVGTRPIIKYQWAEEDSEELDQQTSLAIIMTYIEHAEQKITNGESFDIMVDQIKSLYQVRSECVLQIEWQSFPTHNPRAPDALMTLINGIHEALGEQLSHLCGFGEVYRQAQEEMLDVMLVDVDRLTEGRFYFSLLKDCDIATSHVKFAPDQLEVLDRFALINGNTHFSNIHNMEAEALRLYYLTHVESDLLAVLDNRIRAIRMESSQSLAQFLQSFRENGFVESIEHLHSLTHRDIFHDWCGPYGRNEYEAFDDFNTKIANEERTNVRKDVSRFFSVLASMCVDDLIKTSQAWKDLFTLFELFYYLIDTKFIDPKPFFNVSYCQLLDMITNRSFEVSPYKKSSQPSKDLIGLANYIKGKTYLTYRVSQKCYEYFYRVNVQRKNGATISISNKALASLQTMTQHIISSITETANKSPDHKAACLAGILAFNKHIGYKRNKIKISNFDQLMQLVDHIEAHLYIQENKKIWTDCSLWIDKLKVVVLCYQQLSCAKLIPKNYVKAMTDTYSIHLTKALPRIESKRSTGSSNSKTTFWGRRRKGQQVRDDKSEKGGPKPN